jgi:hypothetical protein
MNSCIFRQSNTCSPCCFNAKYYNYCSIHANNYNIIYEIIDNAIGKNNINSHEIYNIFKYIYNNPKIYTKEFIFKGCLKTLFSNYYYLKDIMRLDNTDDIINKIYLINLKTYNIEKNNYKSYNIIYNFFINNLIKKYKYNTEIILNNTEDPFTLDNINDLNKNELFIYKDNNETNYFFIATELKYFIDTNGGWNPYTKQEFKPELLRHLNYFIKKNRLNKKKPLNKYEWNTIQQAFTDVSQIIEKIGFYNDPRWLLKLTSKQIKNIIKTFKLVSRENSESEKYFININDNTIFYDFARETIKIFENGNDNFILCCNFIKSIALYSDDFYNNIPEWMSDIEMPARIPTIITIPMNNILNITSTEILYLLMNNE